MGIDLQSCDLITPSTSSYYLIILITYVERKMTDIGLSMEMTVYIYESKAGNIYIYMYMSAGKQN